MQPIGQRVLLASGARTADQVSSAIENRVGAKGIRLYLNVTAVPAVPGAGGLKVIVRAIDPVSGNKADLNTGGALLITAVLRLYEIYPDAAAGAGFIQDAVSRRLPQRLDIVVTHADAQSYTYSLAYELLP